MTNKMNSDDLQPAPLPSNKKSLVFTQAVLKHSSRHPRSPTLLSLCGRCVLILGLPHKAGNHLLISSYSLRHYIMDNGLARIASQTPIFSIESQSSRQIV